MKDMFINNFLGRGYPLNVLNPAVRTPKETREILPLIIEFDKRLP